MRQILIIIFLLICFSAEAAEYSCYIADDGTDNIVGLWDATECTEGDPCNTLAEAQACIDDVTSSDTMNLYFARGDTWTIDTDCSGSTPCSTVNWGLVITNDDPVVNVDAYGSGDKPIIDGSIDDFSSVVHYNNGGPYRWSNIFRVTRNGCTFKNIRIQNIFGRAFWLSNSGDSEYGDNLTIDSVEVVGFGSQAVYANDDYGTYNTTITNSIFAVGEQLYRYYPDTGVCSTCWGGAIMLHPRGGSSRHPDGSNVVSYNIIYDIYGEGIHSTFGDIRYNIVGDTASVGIYVCPQGYNAADTNVKYNYVVQSDSNDYRNHHGGSSYNGIAVWDEMPNGSDNTDADIAVYGNIVINRYVGIWFDDTSDGSTYWGSVKIYNNTVIDSNYRNIAIGDWNRVATGQGFIYNNASVLYDNTDTTHVTDWGDPETLSTYWTIDNNAFWTTGGSPSVDTDWDTNAVTTDPVIPGEASGIDWDGLNSGDPRNQIDFVTHLLPTTGSLVGAGKALGSGYVTHFLTTGTDFDDLPDTTSFVLYDTDGSENIGAATMISGGEYFYISASDTTADEAAQGTGSVTISCVGCSGGESIEYALTGTATDATDYNDDDDGSIAYADLPATVTFTPIDDGDSYPSDCEYDPETIIVTLQNATGASIGSPSAVTINITEEPGDCTTDRPQWHEDLDAVFDIVETFDELADWSPSTPVTAGRQGGDLPTLSGGGASMWNQWDYWSTETVENTPWIAEHVGNKWIGKALRMDVPSASDNTAKSGPSRMIMYFGTDAADAVDPFDTTGLSTSGYRNNIYVFYMVKMSNDLFSPGAHPYNYFGYYKFNVVGMGFTAPGTACCGADSLYGPRMLLSNIHAGASYGDHLRVKLLNHVDDDATGCDWNTSYENDWIPGSNEANLDDYIEAEEWWGIEIHIHRGTVGNTDGYMRYWIYENDGTVHYAGQSPFYELAPSGCDYGYNKFLFGGNSSFAPANSQYYVDDLIIDDGRIGPTYFTMYGEGEAPPGPIIQITASDTSASEDGLDTGSVTIDCTNCVSGEGVSYALSGTATDTVDYNDDNTSPISADDFPLIITFTPIDDDDCESPETIIFTLNTPTGGAELGASYTETINLGEEAGECTGTPSGRDAVHIVGSPDVVHVVGAPNVEVPD